MSRNSVMFEIGKRFRRLVDNNFSSRKVLIILIFFCAFLLYFGPSLAQWLFSQSHHPIEAFEDECISERLGAFQSDISNYDAIIIANSNPEVPSKYLPYIGNGLFAVEMIPLHSRVYIKQGRTLSLNAQWDPLITVVPTDNGEQREISLLHLTQGIVHKYQCAKTGYYIANQYYAHRVIDGILIQEISITNPSSLSQTVGLHISENQQWSDTKPINIQIGGTTYKYTVTSGTVHLPDSDKIVVMTIVYVIPSKIVVVKPRSSIKLEFITSIAYGEPQVEVQYAAERKVIERNAIKSLKIALNAKQSLREQHVNLWQSYWHTGLTISESKAQGALNGDKINATIYYVLSQISRASPNVEKSIANNDGCYRGHHTLDAPKLWKDTSTIDEINEIVKAWLITLEKQGCQRLITGDPAAVQQAIVLSLGGLRFSVLDLEFNIDPQYLHRNYLFRRISYGNGTHVNISVNVGEDNRAILSVALDRSDGNFYACDAGCLDSPVPLSQQYTNFPVKLTKPLTAILYITWDYQHMQELRNALHVHAVEEAPAHDHQIMALHKHGHQLGGLPTFFWVSICFLIVIFHMFLCKIIYTEYWGHQDRQRTRYSKP